MTPLLVPMQKATMSCELGDCENSNKKEHKERPEMTDVY